MSLNKAISTRSTEHASFPVRNAGGIYITIINYCLSFFKYFLQISKKKLNLTPAIDLQAAKRYDTVDATKCTISGMSAMQKGRVVV